MHLSYSNWPSMRFHTSCSSTDSPSSSISSKSTSQPSSSSSSFHHIVQCRRLLLPAFQVIKCFHCSRCAICSASSLFANVLTPPLPWSLGLRLLLPISHSQSLSLDPCPSSMATRSFIFILSPAKHSIGIEGSALPPIRVRPPHHSPLACTSPPLLALDLDCPLPTFPK
jgi:hypothetical protein